MQQLHLTKIPAYQHQKPDLNVSFSEVLLQGLSSCDSCFPIPSATHSQTFPCTTPTLPHSTPRPSGECVCRHLHTQALSTSQQTATPWPRLRQLLAVSLEQTIVYKRGHSHAEAPWTTYFTGRTQPVGAEHKRWPLGTGVIQFLN